MNILTEPVVIAALITGLFILIAAILTNRGVLAKALLSGESVGPFTRNQVDTLIGNARTRIENVSEEFCVSANDGALILQSLYSTIEDQLKNGRSVKVIVADPHPESAVPEMLSKIDPNFPNPENFRESMIATVKRLEGLRNRYSQFEYRFLTVLPAMGFFITDPKDTGGVVKFEIYTAKPWKEVKLESRKGEKEVTRPHFVFTAKHREWRNYVLGQWDNYWHNLSREPDPETLDRILKL